MINLQNEWIDVLISNLKQYVRNDPNSSHISENWLIDQHSKHKFLGEYYGLDRTRYGLR